MARFSYSQVRREKKENLHSLFICRLCLCLISLSPALSPSASLSASLAVLSVSCLSMLCLCSRSQSPPLSSPCYLTSILYLPLGSLDLVETPPRAATDPGARILPIRWTYQNKLYLFAGSAYSNYNDIWAFDGTAWTQVEEKRGEERRREERRREEKRREEKRREEKRERDRKKRNPISFFLHSSCPTRPHHTARVSYLLLPTGLQVLL
jgi:hypothetical protein